jgi:hypothetical protein
VVAAGGPIATLVQAIREQERRQDEIQGSWQTWTGRVSCR